MPSAPLRPRTPRSLATAAVLAATATAQLALAPPVPAAPDPSGPPATAPAPAQAAPAIPAPDPPAPTCGASSGSAFPLDTRIQGGPSEYPAGGGLQEWKLDLTNTTDGLCSGIHPVLVLTDEQGRLRPEQIRFEFYDGGAARWRPVAFEATEQAENVGAFTGFDGFVVPSKETLSVSVRLGFRAEAAPDEVVVKAAVVQRRGADGDWVGESDDYRLTVGPAAPAPASPAPSDGTGTEEPAPDTSGTSAPATPSRPPTVSPRPPGTATASPDDLVLAGPDDELASTGRESERKAALVAALAGGLVVLGAVLVRIARRRRHR
ncbi:hypothetical protein ACF09E_07750 [Streptomyces sp. NPDC014891]|uniref:hypothetical protein n=1 Tax=Streptomyces sp. NPDC014891 TaxID=3364929 RepID=UPI0036F99A67